MGSRHSWAELPPSVQKAVSEQVGSIQRVDPRPTRHPAEVAAILCGDSGDVFCKGVSTDSPLAAKHRAERVLAPYLPTAIAPRLLWDVEEAGWLLLGFEYVPGVPADLTPASPHLPLVQGAINQINRVQPPLPAVATRPIARQWSHAMGAELSSDPPPTASRWSRRNAHTVTRLAAKAPAHLSGDTLIHSDLAADNILVGRQGGNARLVDWSWWKTGPPWVDAVLLAARLVAAGHLPAEAEHHAAQIPAFAQASPLSVVAFLASLVRLWERNFPGTDLTVAAVTWLRYRLS